ncbi:MAG: 8-amino-7-oxononanoate synthase [Alphaproteobacteria bacterium]
MESLTRFADSKLDRINAANLHRTLKATGRGAPITVVRAGREMISFCCNDYLGLSQHAKLKEAAIEAIERYGVGGGASRFVTGNNPLYGELEARLAGLKSSPAACVFGSGYLANIGIIPTFAGDGDLIIGDELMHACMHAGARLSGAKTQLFHHNDIDDCRRKLDAHRAGHGTCLVMTEGVFSMEGDRAPVRELAALAAEFDAWLLTDDAHALGVIGDGRGSSHAGGDTIAVPLQMGTLSKAVGVYGGYLCADEAAIDLLKHRARSLIYTTALPPMVLASAIAALELIASDAELVAAPLNKARLFTGRVGLAPAQSAIVSVVLGDPETALNAAQALEDKGFLVIAMRPPTVPEGTSRLRITFSAAHRDAEVLALADCVAALLP